MQPQDLCEQLLQWLDLQGYSWNADLLAQQCIQPECERIVNIHNCEQLFMITPFFLVY